MTYKDTTYYTGEWKRGKKQGEGTLKLGDGSLYTGRFEADNPHGLCGGGRKKEKKKKRKEKLKGEWW